MYFVRAVGAFCGSAGGGRDMRGVLVGEKLLETVGGRGMIWRWLLADVSMAGCCVLGCWIHASYPVPFERDDAAVIATLPLLRFMVQRDSSSTFFVTLTFWTKALLTGVS